MIGTHHNLGLHISAHCRHIIRLLLAYSVVQVGEFTWGEYDIGNYSTRCGGSMSLQIGSLTLQREECPWIMYFMLLKLLLGH